MKQQIMVCCLKTADIKGLTEEHRARSWDTSPSDKDLTEEHLGIPALHFEDLYIL